MIIFDSSFDPSLLTLLYPRILRLDFKPLTVTLVSGAKRRRKGEKSFFSQLRFLHKPSEPRFSRKYLFEIFCAKKFVKNYSK